MIAVPRHIIARAAAAGFQGAFRSVCAARKMSSLGSKSPAHGGKLIDRFISCEKERAEQVRSCNGLSFELTERQACDVELITTGAFSPIEGFMNEDTWLGVLKDMRIPGSKTLFGLPVVLDTHRQDIVPGKRVALTFHGQVLAVMEVESRWRPDKPLECKHAYGSTSLEHPGARLVAMERGPFYLGGKLFGHGIAKRIYPSTTPAQLRARLPADKDVVVFQCRNPIHRAHYELFIRALDAPNVGKDAVVLVHPTCGPTQEDDIDGVTRFRTYEVLKAELNNPRVHWAYLPYSMHMAGPREAIQHMIMRKNYGCTHFIIGRDMAGCKSSLTGKDYYGPYDAQDMARAHCKELGMQIVPSLDLVYTVEEGYVTEEVATAKKLTIQKLSGTEFRKRLRGGEEIPEWFAFKSVVKALRDN
mmetsp:Transcript_67504/g.180361  ORF Transcript_67504/g.180361 Transcript_67504/m.180361 type:complete len:416 (+) Transcript_67504:73-1320(+)